MGSDKALLEIDGFPLVARIAEVVLKVCGSVSLIGDPDRYGSLGLRAIPDRLSGLGPLAGIETALSATESDENLVVACDMPALRADLLEALFTALGDGNAAVPRYDNGHIEPLCAVYRRNCHAPLREALESGVRGVTEALRRMESRGVEPRFELRYLPVAHDEIFANLNTPDDLARYRAQRSSHG